MSEKLLKSLKTKDSISELNIDVCKSYVYLQSYFQHIQSLENRYASHTICPKCSSKLVLRQVKQGTRQGSQFLGCSSYPRCRFTKEIKQESGRSWTRTIILTLIVVGIIWWI